MSFCKLLLFVAILAVLPKDTFESPIPTINESNKEHQRRIIKTSDAPAAIGPYSQAVRIDDTIYISGQLGLNPKTSQLVPGGAAEQARQTFRNIGAILKASGSRYGNIVKTTLLLKDMKDFASVNEVYAEYFTHHAPARAAYQVGALPKNALVEIEVIAISGNCATSGVCPTCGSYYQPQQSSCGCQQRGYTCGSYGCYRMRARGSKTFSPHRSRTRSRFSGSSQTSTSIEADREILQERIEPFGQPQRGMINVGDSSELRERHHDEPRSMLEEVSPTVAENMHKDGPINPNRAFYECCIDRRLPDACLSKCNFNSYTKSSLQAMYFKQDACPIEALKEMQFCAAQGRDHTECCARNGVTTTLAGQKCLIFCNQRVGQETRLDLSYVPCFDRFESMKSCFWHDLTRYYKA